MSHVFISYKREDRPFVDELEMRIERAGLKVWTDRKIPAGENWEAAIDKAIQECFVLLFVVTPKARLSEYVTYEWSYAIGKGVPVIPLLLEQTEIHPRLNKIQHFDFTNNQTQLWEMLIERLDQLKRKSKSLSKKQQENFYSNDEYRAIDVKVLQRLWQFISSSNIYRIVNDYEGRRLSGNLLEETVDKYLNLREIHPELHFLDKILEKKFSQLDKALSDYLHQMFAHANVTFETEGKLIVPHYKVAKNDDIEKYKFSEHLKTTDMGYALLRRHKNLILAIKQNLPEFTFPEY